ncbi:hypothetical protein SRABI133_02070 [Peribacillus simplex]|uniref:Uncharacterized protein n=1 Tax=Peribacillus simplex TaxID=1478 RepID=A0A9W4KV98_9BACI|nr:hypothetical protein SRABI133_02070 [Peribacillus simplex]
MSARNIIGSLEKLIKLHKSFNQLAIRKTAILKANDTEAITALLISEQKHIKAISQTDKERERAVEEFLAANGTVGQPASIHTVTELTGPEDTEVLEMLKAELIDEVAKLKERNGLNQQLRLIISLDTSVSIFSVTINSRIIFCVLMMFVFFASIFPASMAFFPSMMNFKQPL